MRHRGHDEQRDFIRMAVDGTVTVRHPDGREQPGRLVDLSATGTSFTVAHPPTADETLELVISGHGGLVRPLFATAEVVRVQQQDGGEWLVACTMAIQE